MSLKELHIRHILEPRTWMEWWSLGCHQSCGARDNQRRGATRHDEKAGGGEAGGEIWHANSPRRAKASPAVRRPKTPADTYQRQVILCIDIGGLHLTTALQQKVDSNCGIDIKK